MTKLRFVITPVQNYFVAFSGQVLENSSTAFEFYLDQRSNNYYVRRMIMLSEYDVYKNEAIKQFNFIKDQNSYCLFFAGTKTEIVSYLAYRIVSMSEVFSDLSDRRYSDDEKLFIAAWAGELYEAHTSLFPLDFSDNKCYVVSQKNGYKVKPIVEAARKFISRTRGEI